MKGKSTHTHSWRGGAYPRLKKSSAAMRAFCILLISVFIIISSAGHIYAQGQKQQAASGDTPFAPRGPEESKEGFMPTEKVQEWGDRKAAEVNMKNELMANLSGRPLGPVEPYNSSEMISGNTVSPPLIESPLTSIDMNMPEHSEIDFNKTIEGLDAETAKKPNRLVSAIQAQGTIMASFGPALVIRKGIAAGGKAFEKLKESVSTFKSDLGAKEFEIKVEEMPEEIKSSLEPLLEVEGVSVTVPGADYAVAGTQEDAPRLDYDVKDEIFTIDEISLEKTEKGSLVLRVPSSAEKDLNKKTLCFSKAKDPEGKTVEDRLLEGDPATIAKVLAEWARYSTVGFDFSKEDEAKVAKAVIRIVGVGVEDRVVKIEDNEVRSEALEEELRKIIGDDEEAWTRVLEFIHPRISAEGSRDVRRKRD